MGSMMERGKRPRFNPAGCRLHVTRFKAFLITWEFIILKAKTRVKSRNPSSRPQEIRSSQRHDAL